MGRFPEGLSLLGCFKLVQRNFVLSGSGPGFSPLRLRFEGFIAEIIRDKTLWLTIFEKMISHGFNP